MITLGARLFDLTPSTALAIGGLLSVAILLSGIRFSMKSMFEHEAAPFVGLTILLAGWGSGWLWSNFLQMRSLFYVMTYPSTLAFGLMLWSVGVARAVLKRSGRRLPRQIGLVVLLSFTLLTHPLTGLFGILFLSLIVLFEKEAGIRVKISLVLAFAVPFGLIGFWPYFRFWDLFSGSGNSPVAHLNNFGTFIDPERWSRLLFEHSFYNLQAISTALGPSLLGLPALGLLAAKRLHPEITAGFAVVFSGYLLNLFIVNPLGHRFLFFCFFFIQLGLVWWLVEAVRNRRMAFWGQADRFAFRRPHGAVFLFLGVCWLWNLGLVLLEFNGRHLNWRLQFSNPHTEVVGEMEMLKRVIPAGEVILAPRKIGWPMPSFGWKTAALLHPNPLVRDYDVRKQAVNDFFTDPMPMPQRRRLIRRYHISYIVYRKGELDREVQREIRALGSPLSTATFCVIAVDSPDG